MKQKKLFALLIGLLILFAGCTADTASNSEVPTAEATSTTTVTEDSVFQSTPESTPEPTPDPFRYETELFGGQILDIEITAAEEDWAYLMENALEKPWISADITVNGETFSNVGIKTKGNTSLSSVAMSGSTRFSFKLNFGKYEKGQSCYGLDKLALNNIFADNTYMKEYMSYHLMRYMEVPCSLCAYCKITVNGEPWGLYLAMEDVDDSFLARNYGIDNQIEAYKPESMDFGGGPGGGPGGGNFGMPGGPPEEMPDFTEMPAPPDFSQMKEMPAPPGGGFPGGGMSGGVSLQYTDDDWESYYQIFDNSITKIKDRDKERLIESLKAISEGRDLEAYIDVDEVLRYTACNVFLANLDSYFSTMGHNYILTEDRGRLSMLPWDYNLSFGTHENLTSSQAVNYPIDTVFHNVSAEERPLISKLLEVEEYRDLYHRYLRQIAADYIDSGLFAQTIYDTAVLIDPLVQEDSTSFGGHDAFLAGCPALALYGQLRAESVLGQLDGTIPSEQALQAESESLIDATGLDLSLLGSMNIGKHP